MEQQHQTLPRPSEMMMPVSDDHAARLFEIEAMRQITDNLKRLNDNMSANTQTLHGIDTRLVRIESNSVNSKVADHEARIDKLESAHDRRMGATSLLDWIFRNWPGVLGFAAMIFVLLQATGKLK